MAHEDSTDVLFLMRFLSSCPQESFLLSVDVKAFRDALELNAGPAICCVLLRSAVLRVSLAFQQH